MSRRLLVTAAILVIAILGVANCALGEERSPLPRLPGLRPQVQFWKKIFAKYSGFEVVVHDSRYLDRIYSVLDLSSLKDQDGWSEADINSYVNDRLREEKERIRALLIGLHELGGKSSALSPEERHIEEMFADDPSPTKFLDASADDRLRGQRGLKDRFAEAIRISRRYLPEMEAIFRRQNLPLELTRLPFVESCFNVKAYSKVGAAGIWQFMPSSGRRYMTINDVVDERRDPIAATEAAARYLQADYESLGSWPLAITAYNHGRAGMQRAVDSVGSTDLSDIIRDYRGPAFGFASRNFYAEFLAAVEVERNYQEYFGDIEVDRPFPSTTVGIPHYIHFRLLAEAADLGSDGLAALNPALSSTVVNGKRRVPKGYELRLPTSSVGAFRTRYAALPASEKLSKPAPRFVKHQVKPGQSLATIAKRYGTTVAKIQKRNKLGRRGTARTGQVLIIPLA